MVTEKDIKALRVSTSKKTRLAVSIMFPLGIVFMFSMGIANLYLCSRFAEMAGMTLGEFIRSWVRDIDISGQYSGAYLKALDVFGNAVLQFTSGGFFIALFWRAKQQTRRNERILKFIEDKNIEPIGGEN